MDSSIMKSLRSSILNCASIVSATCKPGQRHSESEPTMGLRYDPASQVTQILHQLTASATQINQAAYAYNPVGNRTSLTDRRGSQAFGYDTLDRLTSASHPLLATPQAFAYDPVGNRTTGGSVVNVGNQLTADATHSYQYDDNGNLTRKTLFATGNYSQYTYDAENRLTKVEDFAAGNPTAVATSTYRYDGLGRRIEKVANGQTRRYVYDGEDILLEYDGTNTLQARYTHGPGIDEPIAVTKGGSTFFYHQDGLGTVTDLTDSTGATAKSYAYDAYGNILESPGTVDQPYTYTGRELDSESGLYYYRARYYDPTTGRFLQKDPISFLGGDFNLYSYVGDRPTLFTDALGLKTRSPKHPKFPDYNLPGGYGGRVDSFNVNGESSFEIHVCDGLGKEIGIYGPEGWINKHGKGIPTAIPKELENALKGVALNELRSRGKFPPKGRADIKGNSWRKHLGKGCAVCGIAGAAIGAGAALADGSSASEATEAAAEPFVCPFGCDEAY
jgi:RHS repeat-associated protein